MHHLKEKILSSTTKIPRSLGVNMLEEQISKKDRWLRKKYGCVEFGTGPYDHNYAKVPHQSDCVNGQEHQEKGCLEAGVS